MYQIAVQLKFVLISLIFYFIVLKISFFKPIISILLFVISVIEFINEVPSENDRFISYLAKDHAQQRIFIVYLKIIFGSSECLSKFK